MAIVVVYTDDHQHVWTMDGIESIHLNDLQCPTNVRGSSLAAGIRRAVEDAEAIQEGRDPERASERAMRLMHEAREREAAS